VAQRQATTVSWGVGEVVACFLLAQLAAIVVGGAIVGAVGHEGQTPPLWLVALLQLPLWAGYLLGPVLVTRAKGRGPVADLGVAVRGRDVLWGLALGVAAQLALVPAVYLVVLRFVDGDPSAPARQLVDRATDPAGVVLLVLIAVVAAPLVEELFYRGFLLRALQRAVGTTAAVIGSSAVFAAVHLQLLQFPALFLFGLLAAWVTVRTGRLGMAWAAHVAFNLVTIVILLAG
jgi:membrane protease YdiL (CAAX protease family)